MKTSSSRILTTHAGSLPRPVDLQRIIRAQLSGQPYDQDELVNHALAGLPQEKVRHQGRPISHQAALIGG